MQAYKYPGIKKVLKTWDILAPKEGTKNSFHPNGFPILRTSASKILAINLISSKAIFHPILPKAEVGSALEDLRKGK